MIDLLFIFKTSISFFTLDPNLIDSNYLNTRCESFFFLTQGANLFKNE